MSHNGPSPWRDFNWQRTLRDPSHLALQAFREMYGWEVDVPEAVARRAPRLIREGNSPRIAVYLVAEGLI